MGGETKSYKMDFSELTKNVVDRIQKLEPDNVTKIMGCIFLKDPSEQEMLQLAFGPENILLTKIDDAKTILGILSPNNAETSSKIQSVPNPSHHSGSFPPGLDSRPFSSPPALHANAPYWDPHLVSDKHPLMHNMDFTPYAYTDLIEEDYKDVIASSSAGNYYYQDATFGGSLPSRTSRRSPSLPEFPIKTCHYFSKGYCKHGANCRYFHGQSSPDGYSQTFSQNFNDFSSEEHGFSPGSLEKLEMEITELLRSRKGIPVSIASLPMLYYEKYGRNLQAEGYLTESQRHGKTGFSLTKLLARLKTSIRLIDRPHGQHSVILAEDAPGYFECRNERSEMGSTASSHQIYLTFPAESTFTEDDVSNYFKQFGPVRDVRIPCQDKRMFGFVSFSYPQTVSDILMKRNPHYICGSRVLVKPYREKSRMDRTFLEKMKPTMCHPSHCVDLDSELHAMPRGVESSRISKQHFEEQESLLEHERRRFADFNLVQKPLNRHSYFSCGVDDLQLPEDPINFALEDNFSYKLESLSSSSDDKTRSTSITCKKQESGQMELFESLFACPPPIGSSASSLYRDSETKTGENRDTQKKQHSLLMKSSMILNNQPPPVPPH